MFKSKSDFSEMLVPSIQNRTIDAYHTNTQHDTVLDILCSDSERKQKLSLVSFCVYILTTFYYLFHPSQTV